MSDPTSPQSSFERLLVSLRRLVRFRALRAPEQYIEKEIEIAHDFWRIAALDPLATEYVWPPDVASAAEELGFLGGEIRVDKPLGDALGESPSELSTTDPGAQVQRAAGYEVTDYAGIFGGAGPFLATIGGDAGAYHVRAAPRISRAGHLRVTSGRLQTFDALDSTWLDRTVQSLDREVPRGEHPIYVAHWKDSLVAAVVLFGPGPVKSWAPARTDAERNPMPTPPMLPMSHVRYALGLCDAEILDELLAPVMQPQTLEEVNAFRRALGDPPLGPDDPRPMNPKGGMPPGLLPLNDAILQSTFACSGPAFGVRVEGPTPGNWGLDEHGNVVALAFDFSVFRIMRSGPSFRYLLLALMGSEQGQEVLGYRVFSDGLGSVVTESSGPPLLEEVRWLAHYKKNCTPRRSTQVKTDLETKRTRWIAPKGRFEAVELVFAGVSQPAILLERKSLARRLKRAALAKGNSLDDEAADGLARRLVGLLRIWPELNEGKRITEELERVRLG